MTDIGGPTGNKGLDFLDKAVPIVCGVIMVAFLISLPFMIRDKEARERKAWQDEGCHMYDNMKSIDVPAKCSYIFTDHYKPQQERLQPPDQR